MAKVEKQVADIAKWLQGFEAEKQGQLIKQIQLKAVTEAPTEDLLQAPISTLGDYLEMEIETPPEVVEPGIIVRGEIHTLAARAGKGKTTFLMNCMMRWAAGLPVFDDLPELLSPGVEGGVKSLVIENEGSAGYFQDRMKDLLEHGGYTDEQKEHVRGNMLIWGDGSYSGVKVDDTSKLELLRRGVKKWEPDLVFLDPFRSIWTGNENDGSEMNVAIDNLMQLCHDFECAVFLNHHENKGKENVDAMDSIRGATVFEGAVATAMRWQHVHGGAQSELSFSKMRYKPKSGPPAPIRMAFNFDTWTYTHIGETVLDRQILDMLNGADDQYFAVSEIADELEETERKVRDRLNHLVDEKRVQKARSASGSGYSYRIQTDDPNAADTGNGGLEVG